MIDAEIGGFYTNVVPDPCDGDHTNELQLWQCLACRAAVANKYTIKATATEDYVKTINFLMDK